MPEEVKLETEKDIYVESKVVGKLMEDCDTDYSKPAKAKMVTEMLNGCYEEVILLMGNDCAKGLATDGEVIASDGSDASSIDDESVIGSMLLREELRSNDDVVDTKLSCVLDNGAKNKEFQDLSKQTDVTSSMTLHVIQEPKSLVYDEENKQKDDEHKNTNITSENEDEGSVNISKHCTGDIPYSGSVSLRSASSTASTRSFAFPILAQEWNSYTSPVKMATPDKRRSIKHKLWNKKMNWICCIF